MCAELPAGPASFCPFGILSRLFRRLFLEKLMTAFDAGELRFFGVHANIDARDAFAAFLAPLRKAEWVITPSGPSAGPRPLWLIWQAIRIASPSPTAG